MTAPTLVEQQRLLDVEAGGRACIVCGCTENAACEDGCAWQAENPLVCTCCCGTPLSERATAAGWEPCPLENGHPGGCVFWHQTLRDGSKRRKNGVKIVDHDRRVIAMLDLRGPMDPLSIRALSAQHRG